MQDQDLFSFQNGVEGANTNSVEMTGVFQMQSAVTFAMRKQLLAEHGKEALEKEIVELENERRRQKNLIIGLESRIEALKIRHKEKRAVDIEKRAEEKKFLNFQMDHLQGFLKKIEEQWTGLIVHLKEW